MGSKIKACVGGCLLFFLLGCTVPQQTTQSVDQMNYEAVVEPIELKSWTRDLAADVRDLPSSVLHSLKMTPSELVRHDINAVNVPMNQFLMAMAARYQTSMTVDSSLTQAVTMHMRQVTLRDVFEQLSKIQAIDYERTQGGWILRPATLTTKIYSLEGMHMVRWGHTSTSVPRASNTATALALNAPNGQATTDETSNTAMLLASSFDNSNNISQLQSTLDSLRQVSEQERIVINPSTGVITVTAYGVTHQLVSKFIRQLNYKLSQQVLIEARILEVTLKENYKSGLKLSGTQLGYQSDAGLFQYYTATDTFTDIMTLIREQGRVNVLSSPRISVAHQQRAIIKVGNDSYYATGTSQTNSIDGSTSQVNNLVAYQPFFSGLVLDVTPFVDDQEQITLHVHPYISVVTPDYVSMPLQNTVTGDLIKDAYLRMASTQIRETDTIIKAKSGELIVIAGLMTRGYQTNHRTPGRVNPMTGTEDSYENTEIVILIKPVLMNRSKWKRLLSESRSRLHELEVARV